MNAAERLAATKQAIADGVDGFRRAGLLLADAKAAGDWHEAGEFASWPDYVAAATAGVAVLGREFRPAVFAELAEAGLTQREIAAVAGVDPMTVSRSTPVANATGVDQGKSKRVGRGRGNRVIAPEVRVEIGRLWDEGLTSNEIASKVGFTQGSVQDVLRDTRPDREYRRKSRADEPVVTTPLHRRADFYLRSRVIRDLAIETDWVQSLANRVGSDADAAADPEWLAEIETIVGDLALVYTRMWRAIQDPRFRDEVIRDQRFRDSSTSPEARRTAVDVEVGRLRFGVVQGGRAV